MTTDRENGVAESEQQTLQSPTPQQQQQHVADTTQPQLSLKEGAAVIAFNFFSSTGIVSANKVVFNKGFHFGMCFFFLISCLVL